MATTIRWIDNSSVEKGHRIYKSDTYFTKDSLPPMLVELGPDVKEYVDEDGEDGENWYIVSSFIAGYEVFSEPFIGGLSTAFIHDVFGDGSAVATYRFDGDATDLGENYDGAWSGTEQYDDGVIGQAASFDGSSVIDTGIDVSQLKMPCTLSMFINPEGGLAIFGYDPFTFFGRNGGELQVFQNNEEATGNYKTYTNIFDLLKSDEWNHLVIVLSDYDDVKIYSNGILVKSDYDSSNYHSGYYGTSTLKLGDSTFSGNLLEGKIDQFRIFNRPLTGQKVQALYQEGAEFL